MLYQVLKSIRTALVIGLVTTLVMLPLSILLGILAGYFRGWVDDGIQYLYTTLSSIPVSYTHLLFLGIALALKIYA